MDRSRGIAHIPIERAMELLLANAEALGPAPAPTAVDTAAVDATTAPRPATTAAAPPPGEHR